MLLERKSKRTITFLVSVSASPSTPLHHPYYGNCFQIVQRKKKKKGPIRSQFAGSKSSFCGGSLGFEQGVRFIVDCHMLVAKGNLSRRPDTTPPPLDCDGQSCFLYVGKLILKLKRESIDVWITFLLLTEADLGFSSQWQSWPV